MIRNLISNNTNSEQNLNTVQNEIRPQSLSHNEIDNTSNRTKQKSKQGRRNSDNKNIHDLNDNSQSINSQNPSPTQNHHRKNNSSTSSQSSIYSNSISTQFPSISEIAQMTVQKINEDNLNNTVNYLSSPNDISYQISLYSPSYDPQGSVSPIKEERKCDVEDQENNLNIGNYYQNQQQTSQFQNQNQIQMIQSLMDNENIIGQNQMNISEDFQNNTLNQCKDFNQNINNHINSINNTVVNDNDKSSSKQRQNKGKKFEFKPSQMNLKNNTQHKKNSSCNLQTSDQQSDCQNYKGLRNISHFLKCLKFCSQLAYQQIVSQSLLTLPFEIHFQICSYLSPKDVYLRLAFVNQYFFKMSKDTRLWNYMSRFQNLSINDKYKKNIAVVERRSKGRLFSAISRLDKKQVKLIQILLLFFLKLLLEQFQHFLQLYLNNQHKKFFYHFLQHLLIYLVNLFNKNKKKSISKYKQLNN